MERAYDGKPHADMTIVVKDKTYTTKGFDHTIPPAKIKEFVDYINKIADDSVFKNPILGSYVVEELVGVNVVEKNYFISFDTDKISGFMGCNMYSGTYKLDDENITISPLMATKKYCENEMKNEDVWFKSVSNVSRFEIENKTIFLLDNDNKVVLKATKK
jgi:heat shock protein HslJ